METPLFYIPFLMTELKCHSEFPLPGYVSGFYSVPSLCLCLYQFLTILIRVV